MTKNSVEEYLLMLNYIKNNNYNIRLKEKNKMQNKKIKEYAKKCNDLVKKRTDEFNHILNIKNERIYELEKQIEKLKKINNKE